MACHLKEKPVTLASKSKQRLAKRDEHGRYCIVHYKSTKEGKITVLNDSTFGKLRNAANDRLKMQSPDHRLEAMSSNLPASYDAEVHGIHMRCYRMFTNVPRDRKRHHSDTNECTETPGTSKRQCSATVLFPHDKCLFCNKERITVKGVIKGLAKCITECADKSIKDAAVEKNDESLLCKIRNQDLVAREAHYHHFCRRQYTRNQSRHTSHDTSDSFNNERAHKEAFDHLIEYIEDQIIREQKIERMSMLRERYLNKLMDSHPNEYNPNYKTYKLKDKIKSHFGDKIKFWQPNYRSDLVYSATIKGEAIEKAFELASSDERRVEESALILRRHILDARSHSAPMPWPPSHFWLLSGERQPPDILLHFMTAIISGGPRSGTDSSRTNRCCSSLSQDICYAVTNGNWLMPKHLLLPMTVRHLTGSAELVTILNRYGHGQSYSKVLELETAMCNSVIASETDLPRNISKENNRVLHYCWDNFDLNEETPSGAGTTHSTHGIAIQEMQDVGVMNVAPETQTVPRTKERSVKPPEIQLKLCYARPKSEPKLEICIQRPEFDFSTITLQSFTWLFCRIVGSHFDSQTVPQWSGWLSKTCDVAPIKSVVEYMPPVNASINENTTVQHILETSLTASQEVGQEYAIVTFDLAVAKKAYSLVWQTPSFSKVIVRMGVFHTTCSIFGSIGKLMRGSGLAEIVIESGVCASGSLEKVLAGKHYNRALRVHKLMNEGLERLLLDKFYDAHPGEKLSNDAVHSIQELAENPCSENVTKVEENSEFIAFAGKYMGFKSNVRAGQYGKTAQFWMQYMDTIQMVLSLIRATKENNLLLHIASLHKLCPLFFALDHHNYARYVPVYLLSLMNLDKTHPGAKELLVENGFSVSRSSVPRSRNAVDITIEQTINRHAKCHDGIIGFSRNYSAYYRWCTTRHLKAKYVEATLLSTGMITDEESDHQELQPGQTQGSEKDVQQVVQTIQGYLNPFSTDNTDKLYCLSSGVPASEQVEHDLLHVSEIGEAAMDDFVKYRLVEKSVLFHDPIKRTKLKTFATAAVVKKVTSSNNKMLQLKAERNIFGQLVVLAAQNDIDLELTLSFPLGPVPWSLATADGMPVKTEKAKLLHSLESSTESTTTRPNKDTVHVIDGNAMLQSMVSIPDTFEQFAFKLFKQLPRSERIDFITDTYLPQSIKSCERRRRGTTQPLLLQGPKTKTPHNWKEFMANEENKTQLIDLLFEQWSSSRYASELKDRCVNFVKGEQCHKLSCTEDGTSVLAEPNEMLFSSQEEADTRIILHCLEISSSMADNTTIIVQSPDTDVLVLLLRYIPQINRTTLFDTGTGNKRRLISVNKIAETKGVDICTVLPALHSLTGCDTTSAFVRRGKVAPLKVVEKQPSYHSVLGKLGNDQTCSSELQDDIEALVCGLYGKPQYKDINKLRYDMFAKRFQVRGQVLSSYSGVDMSLLPPCKSSLDMHVRRANYQAYVWLHAHENYPDLPKIEESGWRFNERGQIDYDWVKEQIVPQELVEILSRTDNDDDSVEADDSDEPEISLDEVYEDEDDSDDQ